MSGRFRHVVLFVRAPRIGAVKRRLAADIGQQAAWAFYRRNVRTVARRLARDPRWKLWLAVTPDEFDGRERFWPQGLPLIAQGRGDLGERMRRTLSALPPGPALLVGSDIPGITAPVVWRAFSRFAGHDAIFGPAGDGGYWLVGLSPQVLRADPFRGVAWSTPDALSQTIANLLPGGRITFADELQDIDNGADLRDGRAALR